MAADQGTMTVPKHIGKKLRKYHYVPPSSSKVASIMLGLSKRARTALLIMNERLSTELLENSVILELGNGMLVYHCLVNGREVTRAIVENDIPMVKSLAEAGLQHEVILFAMDINSTPLELVGDLVVKSIPRQQVFPLVRRRLIVTSP